MLHSILQSSSRTILFILISFRFGPQFPSKVKGEVVTTISPGQSIQHVLDSLSNRIAALEEHEYHAREIQYQLLQIASNNSASVKLLLDIFDLREVKILEMDKSLQTLAQERVVFDGLSKTLNVRLDNMDKKMDTNILIVKGSIARLEKVNKIWKNNFKIVSNTFKDLKNKNSE